MKKISLLLIMIVLAGCASYPAESATPPPLEIRTVSGDRLPDDFPSYPTIDLAQSLRMQDIDAVIISKDLLYEARDNVNVRQQLQTAARQTALLIYGATTQDAAQILQLGSPTVNTTTTEYILVAVRATETQTFGGGILVPKEGNSTIDIAADINNYVRSMQKNVK